LHDVRKGVSFLHRSKVVVSTAASEDQDLQALLKALGARSWHVKSPIKQIVAHEKRTLSDFGLNKHSVFGSQVHILNAGV
jgi:hypothetical protein